jgi:drug/metabolite transporter (DMT)-like permease
MVSLFFSTSRKTHVFPKYFDLESRTWNRVKFLCSSLFGSGRSLTKIVILLVASSESSRSLFFVVKIVVILLRCVYVCCCVIKLAREKKVWSDQRWEMREEWWIFFALFSFFYFFFSLSLFALFSQASSHLHTKPLFVCVCEREWESSVCT